MCHSVDFAAVLAPLLRLQANFEFAVLTDVGWPILLKVERRQLLDLVVDGISLGQWAWLHIADLLFLVRLAAVVFNLLHGNRDLRSDRRLFLKHLKLWLGLLLFKSIGEFLFELR